MEWLHTARGSLTDAAMCMKFNKWVLAQHSDFVCYFLIILILSCANTAALHTPDWKFSGGVVKLNRVAKWVAAWKSLKTTALKAKWSQRYSSRIETFIQIFFANAMQGGRWFFSVWRAPSSESLLVPESPSKGRRCCNTWSWSLLLRSFRDKKLLWCDVHHLQSKISITKRL